MTAATDRPMYSGWRESRGIGVAWMSPGETGAVFGLAGVMVAAITIAGLRAGLVLLPIVVGAVVSTLRVSGLPVRYYVAREWRGFWTGRRLRRPYRSGLVIKGEATATLPGALAPTVLVEVGPGLGVGRQWACIWHQSTGLITVTLEVTTQQVHLADPDEFDGWVANWGQWLASLATDSQLEYVAVAVESSRLRGETVGDHIRNTIHPEAPELSRGILAALADRETEGTTSVAVSVQLTFDPAKGPAGSSSIDRRISEIARVLPGMEDRLRGCGIGSVTRATPASLGARLRVAYDPSSAAAVDTARQGDDVDGLAWLNSGPMALDEERTALLLDSGAAVGWSWMEAPRSPVTAKVLTRVLSPGPHRKRVVLLFEPMDPAQAASKLQAERTAATAKALVAQKQKRDESARDLKDREFTDMAAAQEAAGAGLVTMHLYVSTTVEQLTDLPDAVAHVESRAGAAGIRLRRATWSHAAIHATGLGAPIHPARLVKGSRK